MGESLSLPPSFPPLTNPFLPLSFVSQVCTELHPETFASSPTDQMVVEGHVEIAHLSAGPSSSSSASSAQDLTPSSSPAVFAPY